MLSSSIHKHIHSLKQDKIIKISEENPTISAYITDGTIDCSHFQRNSLGTASYIMGFKNVIVNLVDSGALNEVTEHYDFGYRSQK